MKKAALPIFLLCVVIVFIVFSCRKSNNTTASKQSLNQLFSGLRYTPQDLSVKAGRDTIVYGTNGTMLHFYTTSFKDANGNIIVGGTVNLQLTEMYKAADMICNRTTTSTTDGQLLASGGEINITATMNGQAVYANKYGVGFKQKGAASTTMSLFYGPNSNSDSIITWTASDPTKLGSQANGTIIDTSLITHSNSDLYIFDSCNTFTSVNCDYFRQNDSVKTPVNIILPDTSFNENNTQAFVILPNISVSGSDTFTAVLSNTFGALGDASYTPSTHTLAIISEGQTNIVPAGLNYTLVVITNKKGSYYYYEQSGIIPHNGLTATAAMAPETQGDIVSRLQGL